MTSNKRNNNVEYENVTLSGLLGDKDIKTEAVRPLTKEERSKKRGRAIGTAAGALVAALGVQAMALSVPVNLATKAVEWGDSAYESLPSELPEDLTISQRNTLLDINGKPFAEVYSQDRIILDSLDKVSPHVKNALISTEDKRFYEHNGIDVIGTARAFISGSGGASGITQQLVKNLQFFSAAGEEDKERAVEATYARKIQEMKYALDYEQKHSKDEILLNYLNLVSFGSPSTYSIESASQYFFDKPAKDLNVAEAAILVGSVQNPVALNLNKIDPDAFNEFSARSIKNGDEAARKWLDKKVSDGEVTESEAKAITRVKERQGDVLVRMRAEGHLTEEQFKNEYSAPLSFAYKQSSSGNCTTSEYPAYCQSTIDELMNSPRLGKDEEERAAVLAKGGLKIQTYLDPRVQDSVQNRLDKDFGRQTRIVAPVAVVQPGTGGVLASAVNRGYGDGEGNTTIDVPNSRTGTGSTFKMVDLAAFMENGLTPSQMVYGSSCPAFFPNFDEPNGGFGNSLGCDNNLQSKVLNHYEATAYSSNTWFVTGANRIAYKDGEFVGLDPIFDMSKRLGLHVDENMSNRSMSYVLGATGNSTIDMAAAYAAFANEGVFCPATMVKNYEYADGTSPAVPDNYDPTVDACRAAMSPNTASEILKAMRANTVPGVVERAFSTRANIEGYDAWGKSGTNQNFNYTWGQVSAPYSLYINVHDMDKLIRGVNGTVWRGVGRAGNYADLAGSAIMKDVLKGTKPVPLNTSNTSTELKSVPVERRDFFTVPSVLGMSPEQAVEVMKSAGANVNILKEKVDAPDSLPSGVIAEQSVPAGETLAVGSKTEVVLKVSQ